MANQHLPEEHLEAIRFLENAYLEHVDPIKQSGFSGGEKRWQEERSPLMHSINGDGDFLDIGCAVGHLAKCVADWGSERGFTLIPHGLDLNPRLIREAISRSPDCAHQFWVANAWGWKPLKRFRWVYAIWDVTPLALMPELIDHYLEHALTDDGTLIVGAYGSKSRNTPPLDIAEFLRSAGLPVSGESSGGRFLDGTPVARFAWVRRLDWARGLTGADYR